MHVPCIYEICMMMHAIYVCDMYIDGCMLASNVCMRYVYYKMANVQSETLIIKAQKPSIQI